MFIRTMTAHDEEEIMLNTDHIVLITYYPDSNMSKIDTISRSGQVWVDGNFMDIITGTMPEKEVQHE